MTSCIDSPRSAEAFDSPSTQRTASITFDLPQPFGPTMPTSWPGVPMVVGSTNDLNPASLIWVRRKEAGRMDERKRNAGEERTSPASDGAQLYRYVRRRPSSTAWQATAASPCAFGTGRSRRQRSLA